MEVKLLTGRPQEVAQEFTLRFPWPIQAKGIKASLKTVKTIEIVAKKCVDEAFPGDYGGRSKWDINYLNPWKEVVANGLLKDHVEAQFLCKQLVLMKRCLKQPTPLSALDEVRDIIRAIFYGHHNNSFQLMAVHGVQNPDDPVFFIRIHPPVRFSPHGSPLLLLSVIDYPRLEELIGQGNVDREAFQADFHRLVTERVSKEVCIIRASSNEELSLFRRVLRLNSTKMRRSAWQSKNLPRGEDTPWIATFITPLYEELIEMKCRKLQEEEENVHFFSCSICPRYRISCATCFITKVQLKLCSSYA